MDLPNFPLGSRNAGVTWSQSSLTGGFVKKQKLIEWKGSGIFGLVIWYNIMVLSSYFISLAQFSVLSALLSFLGESKKCGVEWRMTT